MPHCPHEIRIYVIKDFHQTDEYLYRNLADLLVSEFHREIILCVDIAIFTKQKFNITHLAVRSVDLLQHLLTFLFLHIDDAEHAHRNIIVII